jgi:2-aminoethylphosphonate-pyruvate transaminase
MKLLNPGPVSMTERVRRALASGDVCHREPEFKELVGRVRERIAGVYEDSAAGGYVPVLLGGSGTCAVETMLSLVAKDETALVVANGVYGERIAAMLKAQGKPCE